MKRILLLGFVFIGCCQFTFAQTAFNEKTVYSFFSKPKKIAWIEHYKGRIDGLTEVTITLAYDGKSCKGLLTYLKSRDQLRLDGELNGKELRLLEVDQNAAVTGQLEGYLEGENIHLNWSNADNSVGSSISLTRVSKETLSPTPCGNNQWVRVFKATLFRNNIELVLQKDNHSELKGIAYFEKENKSYNLSGNLFETDKLKLKIKDNKNKLIGTLEGILENENSISANFFNADGLRSPTTFISSESLKMDCLAYADYVSSYDITFPKTTNHSFNRWMGQLTTRWMESCKKHAFEAKPVKARQPAQRASVRASAWSDIAFYDERIISGFMTFESTWSKGLAVQSFNYDLENNREVLLDDLFKKGFDTQEIVAGYLHEEIENHVFYNDYNFRKWLSRQDFPYFVIHKDGLAFCTAFDPIYGRQEIKISFEKLKPYLKENTILDLIAKK